MALDWLAWAKQEDASELMAKKSYRKAAELIRKQLEKDPADRRLKLQLAEALAKMGKRREAVDVLSEVADELALAGQAAQAIAVLKKIQTIHPAKEVWHKLAYLISPNTREAPEGWAFARERGAATVAVLPAPPPYDPEEKTRPLRRDELEKTKPIRRDEIEKTQILRPREHEKTQVIRRDELEKTRPIKLRISPLFADFSIEELLAVIQGLKFRTFQPGEIIVTQGDPGESVFVITMGSVRAYARRADGETTLVRELGEGEFFGEIALLTGEPRTATITAGERCEVLELDGASLEKIEKTHPRVREVLEAFYEERSGKTLEDAINAAGKKGKRKAKRPKAKARK